MSITGDIYNTDQSITGDGLDTLSLLSLTTNTLATNSLSSSSIANTNTISTDTITVSKINFNNNNILLGRHAGQNNLALQLAGNDIMGPFIGDSTIAIGESSGGISMQKNSICIGVSAGEISEDNTIAIGYQAHQYGGAINSTGGTISIGFGAGGGGNQDANAVAIGTDAGYQNQGYAAFAMGYAAGMYQQGANSVAVGFTAAQNQQGSNAIALGFQSGQNGQGANSIAIGANTAITNQAANSIVLNATGIDILPVTNSGFYVNPIRFDSYATNTVYYNPISRELTFKTSPTGSSGGSGTNGVSILYVGVYSSTYTYYLNNVVYDSGQSYLAILDNFSNKPTSNSSYWALLVTKGLNGANGTSIQYVGVFSYTTYYYLNNVVYDSGQSYLAIQNNFKNIATYDTTYWALLVTKGANGTNGSNGSNGAKGDKGDKGDTGAAGTGADSGSILGIIGTALGGVSLATTVANVAVVQSQILTIQGEIATIQGELTGIGTDILKLQNITLYQTSSTTYSANGTTKFTSDLIVGTGDYLTGSQNLVLGLNGGITQNAGITNLKDTTINGTLTTSQINPSNQTLNIGNSTGLGDIINIGTNGLVNVITIGNGTSIINLNGTVNTNNSFVTDVFNMSSFMNQVGF